MPRAKYAPRKWVDFSDEDRTRVIAAFRDGTLQPFSFVTHVITGSMFTAGRTPSPEAALDDPPRPVGTKKDQLKELRRMEDAPPVAHPRRLSWDERRRIALGNGEFCQLWIEDRPKLSREKAEKCARYLGLEEGVSKLLIEHHERRKCLYPPKKRKEVQAGQAVRFTIYDVPGRADRWYTFLINELRGERLRQVLAPDAAAKTRWNAKLCRLRKTWEDVELTIPEAARITQAMIAEASEERLTVIQERIKDWRRKTQNR